MKMSFLLFATLVVVSPASSQIPSIPRARNPLPLDFAQQGYRQTFALIIGVNYQGRQDGLATAANRRALPPLTNAENDARGLRETLVKYYGYQESNCLTLIGEQATHAAIKEAIAQLRDRAQPDDSVLFFFSGHGLRLGNVATRSGNALAVLPYDVQLSRGIPTDKYLHVPRRLVEDLQEIPSRHKLLILDCCYSGEIFNVSFEQVGFQARSETDPRNDERLQRQETFQAIASCRATQVASDGSGRHSPFTAALIDGLKRLPARDSDNRRVWSNRLMSHIRPNFTEDQRPDCRNLFGSEGEFCFYPGPVDLFESFKITPNEQNLLRATVVSHQGNWWFEEMPWFIPSVREQIIRVYEAQQEKSRGTDFADLINPAALQDAAEDALKQPARTPLDQLRLRHARLLRETYTTKDFSKSLETILADLTSETVQWEAPDVHLRAVVQHVLNQHAEAQNSYRAAIAAYEDSIQQNERPLLHILQALCHADLAELLLNELREAGHAAEKYQQAHRLIEKLAGETDGTGHSHDAAAIFRIYTLCCEADAWLQVNYWRRANDCLDRALDSARSFAPDHYLTAHVHRHRAWSEIIQWQVRQAECSFRRSNEILAALFRKELGLFELSPRNETYSGIPKDNVLRASASSSPACGIEPPRFVLPPAFHRSKDFLSKVAYLHNLHGIAMAQRFQGRTVPAAALYRSLTGLVEETLGNYKAPSTDDNTQQQLIGRVINTQERLGDCNLFGNPEVRELEEAADDYRRAMNQVHRLSENKRDRSMAMLWYKQALARSLPSPIRDTSLALEMCRRADEVFTPEQDKATGLFLGLGKLTTAIVTLMDADQDQADAMSRELAVAELRIAIHQFRDQVGDHPHRDQLELALFACKALLEQGGEENRYQALEDTELLLSFCRIALSSYQTDSSWPGIAETAGMVAESRAYLRPYFDVAMRSKLRVAPNHVKDLLEIQWEATNGIRFVKHQHAAPTLAIYILDGSCYLLVDVPQGESSCISLAEFYDVNSIRNACRLATLPLPRKVHQILAEWADRTKRNGESPFVYCYWEDPVRKIGIVPEEEPGVSGSPGGQNRRGLREMGFRGLGGAGFTVHFPFNLPPEINANARTDGTAP